MAIDVSIANFVAEGRARPTVRFYNWQPHCLSLGYNQSAAEVDFGKCAAMGVEVARRPTGGRAVLHAEEFTYSVIFPADSILYRDTILNTYLLLANWLIAGLGRFGIRAEMAPRKFGRLRGKAAAPMSCFSIPSSYEIVVEDKKIIGSAQRRWPNAVLQHGSILVGEGHLKIAQLLRIPEEKRSSVARKLAETTAWLSQHMEKVPSLKAFGQTMIEVWQKMFPVEVVSGQLSGEELVHARTLAKKFRLDSHAEISDTASPLKPA